MNVAYVTNAWGSVMGHPGGISSVKDAFYISTGSNETALHDISKAGFTKIEIFDGNLLQYQNKSDDFLNLLKENGLVLSGVYTAANFIFEDILEEELLKIEGVVEFANICGAKHLTVGGGAIRTKGRCQTDFALLGKGLDSVSELCDRKGLIASYHPHMGSLVENDSQIDFVMEKTKMNLCPDLAHIAAAGSDPVKVVEKYLDRIIHIHLKDYRNGDFCGLGDGTIDIEKVIRMAKNAPHEIDFTVEADGVAGDSFENAQKAYHFLKGLL